MNSNSPLFAASPEDLALRIKNGDGEAALSMGLLCLSGLGNKQDIDQASSYFVKAKQLGAKNADVLIAYVYECNGRMTKAIDTYVGKEPVRKEDEPIASIINKRFKKVSTERKKLQKVVSEYGLPKCPTDTPLNVLLESLESGEKSLSDVCSTLSACDNSEHWCEDTAWLFYEEGEWELANIWMKKSHEDEKWLSMIQDKLSREIAVIPEVVEIEGSSLLGRNLTLNVISEKEAARLGSFKKELKEWGRECNLVREEQRRIEEEKRRKEEEEKALQERLKKEAEERALQERLKKEAEERAKKNALTQNKKGKETLSKAEKPSEKSLSSAPTDYHQLFAKGLFWFEESLTLRDEDLLPFFDHISRDAKKRDVKAMTLMGYHFYLQQDYGKAQAFYDDAYSTLKKDDSASNSIFMAGLCFDLAQVILRQGKTMTALDGFENCLKKLEESKEDTSEEKAMVYYHMGRARAGMGHSRIGRSCIDKALSILEKNKSKHALGIGIIYNQLALWNYSYSSSYKEALQFHLKALNSFQQLEEGTTKTSMIKDCNDSIGGDYYHLEDYPKALEYYTLANNKHRINQLSEIVSYSEKDKRIKCTFDDASVYPVRVKFTFSIDSNFDKSCMLAAKCFFLYLGTDFPIKRIEKNKVAFSIPEEAIRRNKYFTLEIQVYRLFKSKIEDAGELDYYLLDSKRFNFSRKRYFFFGSVKSVSREY